MKQTENPLFSIHSKEQLATYFQQAKITSLKEKTRRLRQCMGIKELTYYPQADISAEDEYCYEEEIFLEGSWRLFY